MGSESENVRVLRRFLDLMGQRETVRDALAMVAPDFVAHEPEGLPYSGKYCGPDGFLDLMKAVSSWAVLDVKKVTLRDADDVVVAHFELTVIPLNGGESLDTRIVELYQVRDGMIHGISIFYYDTAAVAKVLAKAESCVGGPVPPAAEVDMSSYESALEYIRPVTGTYEEARQFVGRRGDWVQGPAPISEQMVRMFCASIRDAHPGYWDRSIARELWGDSVVPPALLQSATLPLPWYPPGMSHSPWLQFEVPLPGDSLIVVSTEAEFHRPLVVDEILSHQEEIVDISEERATRLGPGHFMTTVLRYVDSRGQGVATVTSVLLRFKKGSDL